MHLRSFEDVGLPSETIDVKLGCDLASKMVLARCRAKQSPTWTLYYKRFEDDRYTLAPVCRSGAGSEHLRYSTEGLLQEHTDSSVYVLIEKLRRLSYASEDWGTEATELARWDLVSGEVATYENKDWTVLDLVSVSGASRLVCTVQDKPSGAWGIVRHWLAEWSLEANTTEILCELQADFA